MDQEIQIALIGAGAALLGSIIGASATIFSIWINKKIQEYGKVNIYTKFVHSKSVGHYSFGFYNSTHCKDIVLKVPLWIDVCNTSGVSKVVRNVNLIAYSGEKMVADFTQIQKIVNNETETILLGNNESYTLVIPKNSANRYCMEFSLYKNDVISSDNYFDKIMLSYLDERDKLHLFHLVNIEKPWQIGTIEVDNKWHKMDNNSKFKFQK